MPDSEGPATAGITMWGPPASGKTTFLAALHTAMLREDTGFRLVGANAASANALAYLTASLTSRGEFPRATATIERLSWTLIGQRPQRGRRLWRRGAEQRPIRIVLDLVDAPGEAATASMGSRMQELLVERLADSRGIIIFFDPTREYEVGDTFDHVAGLLSSLSYVLRDESGSRLPHHVAVCITKFDDLRLLRTAQVLRLLEYDAVKPHFPGVPERYVREYLSRLCQLSANGTAELMPKLIDQTFYPDRVRYFVTSAIGFYVNPELGVYDPDDVQNVVPGDKTHEPSRIRGSVQPINVVEPVLWLARQVNHEPPG